MYISILKEKGLPIKKENVENCGKNNLKGIFRKTEVSFSFVAFYALYAPFVAIRKFKKLYRIPLWTELVRKKLYKERKKSGKKAKKI